MKGFFRKIVNRKPWFPPKESASLSHKILRSPILDRFFWQIVLHQHGHTTIHDHPFNRHRIHNWLGHRSKRSSSRPLWIIVSTHFGRVSLSMLGLRGSKGMKRGFECDSNGILTGWCLGGFKWENVGNCGKKDICDIGTLITLIEK